MARSVRAAALVVISAALVLATAPAGSGAAAPSTSTTPSISTTPSVVSQTPEVTGPSSASPDDSASPSTPGSEPPAAPSSSSSRKPPVSDARGWTAYTPETPSARMQSNTTSCATGRFSICEGTFYKEAGVAYNGQSRGLWRVEIKVRGTLDSSNTTVTVGFEVKFVPIQDGSTNPAGLLIYLDGRTDGIGIGDKDFDTIPFRIATGTSTKTKTVTPPISEGNNEVSGIHFTYQHGTEVEEFGTQQTLIRCDDNTDPLPSNRLPGCVNVFWTPTVSFPAATYPFISANIVNGQSLLNGLGAPGVQPLIRADSGRSGSNQQFSCSDARTLALIGARPAPNPDTGEPWECDEYPFASTTDGGRSDGVIKWVPKWENDSQGAVLRNWYSSNRLLVGDWFYVQP